MKNMNWTFTEYLAFISTIALIIAIILFPAYWDKYNLYDYLKQKRLEAYYNQKYQDHLLTCIYCKGTGERVEDVNRTMFMAKVQLYLNKHLMVDKCKECVKLEHGDAYSYCDKAENQYQIFLQEYGAAGPKITKTSCSECLGMGQFSSFDIKTQRYLSQEEYEIKEKRKNK